jgi:K+ transporter
MPYKKAMYISRQFACQLNYDPRELPRLVVIIISAAVYVLWFQKKEFGTSLISSRFGPAMPL